MVRYVGIPERSVLEVCVHELCQAEFRLIELNFVQHSPVEFRALQLGTGAPRTAQIHFGHFGVLEGCTLEARLWKLGPFEDRLPQVRIGEVHAETPRFLQNRFSENRAREASGGRRRGCVGAVALGIQLCLEKRHARHVRRCEVGTTELSLHEGRVLQVRAVERCSQRGGLAEVGADELSTLEVRASQLRPRKAGLGEVGFRHY
mmetsp:Transcript_99145/g.280109  ORF Transcript_99145/g.280109 Transcript_99145/m.280109 type:complete len:204 (-) Transcript_99145:1013-1624(-)